MQPRAAAAGGHVVIALRTQNIAVARAHTHGVEHQAGQFGTAHEGIASCMSVMPGPELEVAHNMPVQAAPAKALETASSLSICSILPVLRQEDDGHALHDVGRWGNRVGKMEFNTTTRQTFRECFRVF